MVVDDVAQDPRHAGATHAGLTDLSIAARITVPLVKHGRAAALLVVHQSEPRRWTETEVKLVQETAERTWAAVERARAENALRESELKYRTLFESMDQGFGVAEVSFDGAGEAVDFSWIETNPAFERHTGFFASADKTVRDLVPDLEQKWFDVYGAVAKTGEPTRFVEGSDALGRWFDVYAFPLGEPQRRQVAVLFTDVTERIRNEESLQRANNMLIDSDQRKDEFLAMLAHELRNPLAAIANTVKLMELVSSEQLSAERSQHFRDILKRQTNMLRGLVDDLLDVSRITRGLVELKQQRTDLKLIAERALESVQALMDEKDHEVSVTLPRKPLEVNGDPVRLEQIMVNLLTNAAKYTDPGGRITLCLERTHESAQLYVSDTGIGMSAEVLDRIFELFGQAERGLARSEGGLGIGLTIVKNLVELHTGSIKADSAGPGQGARFIVTLPLAPVEERLHEAEKKEPKAANREKRILVVEDSEDIAETMALLLEAAGHQLVLAYDGPEALARAEDFKPEVILLDIGLPGMDGYEVARRLRQNPRTRDAVLVALTGYGQAEDIERAHEAGFAKHFTKPVEMERLERFISTVE